MTIYVFSGESREVGVGLGVGVRVAAKVGARAGVGGIVGGEEIKIGVQLEV